MFFVTSLCLSALSEILLIAVALSNSRTTQGTLSSRLYCATLYGVIFLLAVDLCSRLDGLASPVYPILNGLGNFTLFLFNPVFPSLWFLYAHNQVFCDDRETKKLGKLLSVFLVVNTVLTVLSQFNGWYYVIDSGNIYHRGPLFLFPLIIDQAIMLAAFLLLIVNRKRMERRYYFALLSFGVLPVVCTLLQFLIYGIPFALNGIAVSLVIIYINTQNQSMNVDYLTGIFNRKQLDYYVADKIRRCSDTKPFSAILLDLDNFKTINDRFGHSVGDDALKTTVMLLKNCIRRNDFLARFGGDEFYIIMDMAELELILAVVKRINSSIEEFNRRGEKPYKLSLSMGYFIYDGRNKMSVEEFEAQIDQLMYLDKAKNKAPAN